MNVDLKVGIRLIAMTGVFALGVKLPAYSWRQAKDAAYLPNYAARMATPVENGDAEPKLVMVRTRFPIRVTIVDDPNYRDPSLDRMVREACRKWAAAMKDAPERKFKFNVDRRQFPKDADIIVQFGTARDFHGFGGFTAEYQGWAEVRIALEDENGKPIPRKFSSRVAVHEMGHALGIWGHSPDPGDVMSLNHETHEISSADVNTLRLAYHPSNKNR